MNRTQISLKLPLTLHEEPVVPAPPESIALSQQLLEVSDWLNDGPPTLGHRDRLGGAQPLKVHQADDSWKYKHKPDVVDRDKPRIFILDFGV